MVWLGLVGFVCLVFGVLIGTLIERQRWNRWHTFKRFDAPTCTESWTITPDGQRYLDHTNVNQYRKE